MKYKKKAFTLEEAKKYIENRISIDTITGCWNWNLYKNSEGYGAIGSGSRVAKNFPELKASHRASYTFYNGPIPEGEVVRHLCVNPSCCNPRHLVTGTQLQNMMDRSIPLDEQPDCALVNMKSQLECRIAALNRHINIIDSILVSRN